MKRFCNIALLLTAGMLAIAGPEAHAKPRTISECSQKLTARGFNVIDKEIDDNLQGFEAIKNNLKWDVKMEQQWSILPGKIDD